MSSATYTIWIVTRSRDHHYPVIMANNGKAILNEPVNRAAKLQKSAENLRAEFVFGFVPIRRITEAEFKAKFPRFAPNKGGKKKTTKTTKKA
jgi:hypothetical protein